MPFTHNELCERAKRWLAGSHRCEPVFSNIASCAEIPDAIGWSSCHMWRGSTLVECKTSLSDFYADQKKKFNYKHREHGWQFPAGRITLQEAKASGYERVDLPMMGDFRFYMTEPSVLSVEQVEKHAPDHGLLYIVGRSVRIAKEAPRRTELVDKDGEIRYLRFAIINSKKPYQPCDSGRAQLNFAQPPATAVSKN